MKLSMAIARSSGNKAEAISNNGQTIVVQERYNRPLLLPPHYDTNGSWLHVWRFSGEDVAECDLPFDNLRALQDFGVDVEEDYWDPIR